MNPPEDLKTLARENLQNSSGRILDLHSRETQPCRKIERENVMHPIRGLVFFWLQRDFSNRSHSRGFSKIYPSTGVLLKYLQRFFAKLRPQRVNARNPSVVLVYIIIRAIS